MEKCRPQISVCIITYNQSATISCALDSVLSQNTTVPYEVIVSDDASTDGSQQVIAAYKNAYPDIIHPIFNSCNYGTAKNLLDIALPSCRGDYIATLEGDDYWVDNKKLEKQYCAMRSNDRASLCYTDYYKNSKSGEDYIRSGRYKVNDPGLDILKGRTPHLSNWLFRREALRTRMPEQMYSILNIDLLLAYMLALQGELVYIDEPTSVYQVTGSGVYSSLDETARIKSRMNSYLKIIEMGITRSHRRAVIRKLGDFIPILGANKKHIVSLATIKELLSHDFANMDYALARYVIRLLRNRSSATQLCL